MPDAPIPNKPGVSNWLERAGGLPDYIRRIAEDLHGSGHSVSGSIAIAVAQTRKWAAGGKHVHPDTQAKAAAAQAEWEQKRVRKGYDPAEPRDDHGRWAKILGHLLHSLQSQGGFTISPYSGSPLTTGYAVARAGHTRIFSPSNFTSQSLYHYLADNADTLANDPSLHLGGWHDTTHNEYVLDLVEIHHDRDHAIASAQSRDEQAIYDLSTGTEIPIGGSGGRAEASSYSGTTPHPVEGHDGGRTPDLLPGVVPKDRGRAERYWGKGLDPLFGEGQQRPVPFPQAPRLTGHLQSYDSQVVARFLSLPHHTTNVDPRTLYANQSYVTKQGVSHYLANPDGPLYGENDKGNLIPLIYQREDGANVILSGHHRAAAALLAGRPLYARVVSGPWPKVGIDSAPAPRLHKGIGHDVTHELRDARGRWTKTPGGGSAHLTPVVDPFFAVNKTWRKYVAMNHPRPDSPHIAKVQADLTATIPQMHVHTRVPDMDILTQILDNGRFLTQHESGHSRGMFSPDTRRMTEVALHDRDPLRGEHAYYGYLHPSLDGGVVNGYSDEVSQYGSVVVTFKDHVKPHTTFTQGDSLDESGVFIAGQAGALGEDPNATPLPMDTKILQNVAGVSPSPMLNPSPLSLIPAYLPNVADMGVRNSLLEDASNYAIRYWEAQIHQPLTPADIAHVSWVPPDYMDAEAVGEFLDSHHIPYTFYDDAGNVLAEGNTPIAKGFPA